MPFYEIHASFVDANQMLDELVTFLQVNGWTIDHDDIYNTSYRRIHFHKGGAHFDFYSYSATNYRMIACTGWDSGETPENQINASTATFRNFRGYVGHEYIFISTADAVYVVSSVNGTYYMYSCFGKITEKIGSWSDGILIQGGSTSQLFGSSMVAGTNGSYGQVYVNGEWSSASSGANSVSGSGSAGGLTYRQPNIFNGAVTPIPIVLLWTNAADTTKLHPLGFAPGIYRIHAGDIYQKYDIITIDADDYLVFPYYNLECGEYGLGDYLFKLGS